MNRSRFIKFVPLIAILWMAWLNFFPVRSVDAHYHLAVGQWILEHRAIPETGIFSGSFGDKPWHDNEWGFQVIAASVGASTTDEYGVQVLTKRGLFLLILLRVLALAGTLICLNALFKQFSVKARGRTIYLIWVGFLTFGNMFWTVRPQSISYLLFGVSLLLIERGVSKDLKVTWLLVPLATLWSNIHGMFILLPVLIAIEGGGAVLQWLIRKDQSARRSFFHWLWLGLAVCIAAAIHPYGYEQLLHPFRYLFEEGLVAGNAEWIRPNLLKLPLYLFTIVVAVGLCFIRPAVRPAAYLRLAAFLYLGTSALRHLPVAAIVLVVWIAYRHVAWKRMERWPKIFEVMKQAKWQTMVMVVACLLIVFWSGAFTRSQVKFVSWVPEIAFQPLSGMPEREVRWLALNNMKGSTFNSYRTGGFLMFRLYPNGAPIMDGRNDLHGLYRDEVYNPLRRAEGDWQTIWQQQVKRHNITTVLLDDQDPLVNGLQIRLGYQSVDLSSIKLEEEQWSQSETRLLIPPD